MVRRLVVAVLAIAGVLLGSAPLAAHEIRPAYLSLTETRPDTFAIVWKVPLTSNGLLAIDPVLPATCTRQSPQRAEAPPGALTLRWSVACPGGLVPDVGVSGLDRTLTSVFVRIDLRSGRTVEGLLTASEPRLSTARDAPPAALAYFSLGIEHILSGLDHLGFVLGLLLIVSGWRRLLATLSAFTIAHSITLGASALGFVAPPQRAVEVVIAFSIAVAAREAFLVTEHRGGFATRAPWVMAFGFGLLHGFGFANALAEIGLPQDAKLSALLLFNLGVEAGQIMVASALTLALLAVARAAPRYRIRFAQATSIMLGTVAMVWVCERLMP